MKPVLALRVFAILSMSCLPLKCIVKLKRLYFCIFCREVDLIDVVKVEELFKSFKPNLVIHLASWVRDNLLHLIFYPLLNSTNQGMSGPSMLDPKCQVYNVSVTSSLIDLSVQYDVKSFIYTSTYNVVFGGREIAGGDESCEYFPAHQHTDWYSRSKSEAEQLVLSANGKETKGGTLH